MQWVKIEYPERRDVFIVDYDTPCGVTNHKFPIGEGTYTLHLGSPVDYEPETLEVSVSNTSEFRPLLVRDFRPRCA